MYKITASIIPLQEYSTGSGLTCHGYADSTVVKSEDGLPFIPSNHLKGKIRDAVEDICCFLKILICDSENSGKTFCGIRSVCGKDNSYLCPVCQIFGSSFTSGCFNFSNANYSEDIIELFNNNPDKKLRNYQVEHNTRINHETKTAFEHHLRNKESVVLRLPLEFSIRQKNNLKYEEDLVVNILLAGLRFTRFIGSRRTKGRGNVIIDNIIVLKDDQDIDYKKQIEELFK